MNNNTIYKCEICGKEFDRIRSLSSHIHQIHGITVNEYYDIYLKKQGEGICIDCGNTTKFLSLKYGYKKYCKKCGIIHSGKNTSNIVKNKTDEEKALILQKRIQTNIKKYGTVNPAQSYIIQEKMKQTNLDKYGVDNYFKTDEFKEKVKQINLDKYGVEYYTQSDECKEKIKNTNMHNWHANYYAQTDEAKARLSNTWLSKDKDTWACIIDKRRNSNINKYGKEWYLQTDAYKQKTKETNLKKYGVEYYFQSDVYLQRLEEIQQKMYNTKKKNGTFNTSKIEDGFAQYLIENNYQYERQYKSIQYPFNCDFYLLKFDLYIEINASWTHGKHSFDNTNENDIQLLNEWKSKHAKYYDNAIEVWTVRDVNKQQIAKQNNLNYLIIYSNDIKEVILQFENYIKNNFNN